MNIVRKNSEFLSYSEIADRLAIKTESARKLIERQGWQKEKGKDGRMGGWIPADELASRQAPMINRLRARIERDGQI